MTKYEIKYMLEQMTSNANRLIDALENKLTSYPIYGKKLDLRMKRSLANLMKNQTKRKV